MTEAVTETVCTVCVLFRDDRAYNAYLQNVSPVETQVREAQRVCHVSSMSDLGFGSLETSQLIFVAC